MTNTNARTRGLPGWLVALAVTIGAIGAMWLAWDHFGPVQEASGPPGAEIVVRYEGHNWIPVDPALASYLPDDQMAMVGVDGHYTLWANRVAGLGGGGGGGAPKGLETGAYHRIYVRLDDGRYLPMMWQSAAPEHLRRR